MIKQNRELNGITINQIEYRLSQLLMLLRFCYMGQKQSVKAAFDILNSFAHISGLKINNSKIRAVWIGSKKFCGETSNHRFKLDWNQGNFVILGIKFSCNIDDMINLNYTDKITQIERELKQWSERILTPFGRITILKAHIIAKLNHIYWSNVLTNQPR